MRLGEFYASMNPDIECTVCGAKYETRYGKCGKWYVIDGEWKHWCNGSWHPTRSLLRQ
jgi:hypothetical protein